MTQPASDFRARLAALRESQATQQPVAPDPTPVANSTPAPAKGTLDDGAKAELRELDLLTVYRKWFPPAAERQGGNDEVNLSCFNDDFHANGDRNPQFGINTRTQLYYCHACNVAGDIIDLAANYYGDADSNYKCIPEKVHEVVKKAGEELCGWVFRPTKAGYQRVPMHNPGIILPGAGAVPVPVPQPGPGSAIPGPGPGAGPDTSAADSMVPAGIQAAPVPPVALGPAPTAPPQAPGTLVLARFTSQNPSLTPNMAGYTPPQVTINPPPAPTEQPNSAEQTEEDRLLAANFSLDWRSFVPENTPLRKYLELVTVDDSPEEFHFWNFMSLIGLAMGKKVFIPDVRRVYGNLLTCIIGRTGQGKSRSEAFVSELIAKSAKFDEKDHHTNGIRIIKNPGSGEFLAAQFLHEVPDPASPPGQKKPEMLRNPSVKALIRWPEMATMVGKASGKGSIIQQTVIELYDVPDHIGGGSLTNGIYGADNPFGSVATTTQLDSIRSLVTNADAASGFLNRWLFVIGQSKQFQPFGEIVSTDALVPDVRRLLDWSERKWTKDQGCHRFSGAAAQLAADYMMQTVRPLEESGDDMLARVVLTFKKLCLLFSANMMEDTVSVNAVEQAKVAFVYLVDCLKHIGVRIQRSEMGEFEEAILDAIRKGGAEGRAPFEIRKEVKRKNGEWTTPVVNRMFDEMEKAEVIELRGVAQPNGRVGAPRKRYFIMEEQ